MQSLEKGAVALRWRGGMVEVTTALRLAQAGAIMAPSQLRTCGRGCGRSPIADQDDTFEGGGIHRD